MIYLYIKTHNKTGLKYFGKTIRKDPYSYLGSGTYWKKHLAKHGNDIHTEIIGEYENEISCRKDAIQFSIDNNIIESKEWANLKIETLDGGWDHINTLSKEIRLKKWHEWWGSLSAEEKFLINKKKSSPSDQNHWFRKERSGKNNPRYGATLSEDHKLLLSTINRNKIVVKDINTGKTVGFIEKTHPNVIAGLWVSINNGHKHTEEFKTKRSELARERCYKPPSQVGKLWWNDGSVNIRAENSPGTNFTRGRIKWKH
jgi:hypothetical protein